jgi:hypothetical protein
VEASPSHLFSQKCHWSVHVLRSLQWRSVQFSCFLMMFYCPVQVEATPSLLFPDGLSLSSTGGGLSQPPAPSDVPLVCTDRDQTQPPAASDVPRDQTQPPAPSDVSLVCIDRGQYQPPAASDVSLVCTNRGLSQPTVPSDVNFKQTLKKQIQNNQKSNVCDFQK